MIDDETIRTALTDIKTSMRDGFLSVQNSVNQMVTRVEHEATVRRLDAQHASLARELQLHIEKTDDHVADYRRADEIIRTEFSDKLEKELEKLAVATRWAIGLSAGIVGTICTIIFGIINLGGRA